MTIWYASVGVSAVYQIGYFNCKDTHFIGNNTALESNDYYSIFYDFGCTPNATIQQTFFQAHATNMQQYATNRQVDWVCVPLLLSLRNGATIKVQIDAHYIPERASGQTKKIIRYAK